MFLWETGSPQTTSEVRKSDRCAGKAYVGRVFIQELPVGQELLTIVSILPPRCC